MIRGNVHWRNCPLGKLSIGELYAREISYLGELRREKVRRGTVKIPIDRELCEYQPKFQPSFLKQNIIW